MQTKINFADKGFIIKTLFYGLFLFSLKFISLPVSSFYWTYIPENHSRIRLNASE